MGFSTLDGLIMGSRSGAIDPGVLLHLLRVEHISPETLHHKLYHQSGLLGLSRGLSSDVRTLSESKNPHAAFALKKLVSSLTQHTGGLIALMGGIDAFVFTGGIGENARHIRQQLIQNLNFLGLNLNNAQNQKSKEGLISNPEDTIPIFIVNANEEAVIASLALECISSHQKSS
jgi:acetate kinase